MSHPIADQEMKLYAQCMEEIKRREIAFHAILTGSKTTSFPYTNAEFCALQVRKILELIVFASVASNKGIMGELFEKATDTWRIRRVVEIVAKANPKFYPHPIVNKPTPAGIAPIEWVDRPNDWLTLEELIEAYDDLGRFLHANSPYHLAPDVDKVMLRCVDITKKVVALLDQHIVHMPGDKHLLNVQMNASADGKDPNGHVSCSIFEAEEPSQVASA
jgi:hypothetical protein